jgi:hypothetical protein
MTELQTIKRKIQLKRQAIEVIKDDIIDLRFNQILIIQKGRLEKQINKTFDLTLSRKLDAIQVLLDE